MRNQLRKFVAYCMLKGLFKDDLIFSDYELVEQYLEDSDLFDLEKQEGNLDKGEFKPSHEKLSYDEKMANHWFDKYYGELLD